jgi:hypothetical protein
MDYVKQAFALSNEKKELALTLYKKSVAELVQKDYEMQVDDAHTELSSIFGEKWLIANSNGIDFFMNFDLYAESNIAFNYANFRLGTDEKFVKLAKELVCKSTRINDKQINSMAKTMNYILTKTTAEQIRAELI